MRSTVVRAAHAQLPPRGDVDKVCADKSAAAAARPAQATHRLNMYCDDVCDARSAEEKEAAPTVRVGVRVLALT